MNNNSIDVNENIDENKKSEKYLTFIVDGQLFALESKYVLEILRMQPYTYMPKVPEYIKGVFNIRGKVIPLMDLRLKLNKKSKEYDDLTSIIVNECGSFTIGYIVDCVQDVIDIDEDQISDPPKLSKNDTSSFISGIAKLESGVAMVLDSEKVLADEKIKI